jgi:hypothetical protein
MATEQRQHLYSYDMQRSGGKWLAAARTWLQSNVMNGESVRWGSGEMIHMTERQYEDAAAHIAAAAVNEERQRLAHSAGPKP